MKIKVLLIFFCLNIFADRIESFHSNIKINKDRTIDVSEEIEFYLNQPRPDILRTFPTDYSKDGLRYIVPFKVLDVKLNNKKVNYSVEKYENGYEVKIGDFTLFSDLSKSNPKTYTVEIKYQTGWQIGFFDNHDELYWNVTGNGWPYKINSASAKIELPEGVKVLNATSYYGGYGSRLKAMHKFSDNFAYFKTKDPLFSRQGLTIAVSWPKGILKAPTFFEKLIFYLKNNLDIFGSFFILLLLLIYFLIVYFKTRIKKDTVIPLFSPPEDMIPVECDYILNHNFNYQDFSASIVDMGVRGYLTIDCKKNTFSYDKYTLNAKKEVKIKESYYQSLYQKLFLERPFLDLSPKYELKISNSNWRILKKCFSYSSNFLSENLDDYFDRNLGYWFGGFFPSFVTVLFVAFTGFEIPFAWVVTVLFFALNILFYVLLKEYTPEGEKIRAKVEGFKMFLSFTEKERLKYTACPERTPQEYETYLPYAIAFGIEELWTRQFSSLFKMLEAEGNPYSPTWYNGYSRFRPRTFSSSFSRAVASSAPKISSSGSAPGSSSGFGGGGFSGGGGGGGGGR